MLAQRNENGSWTISALVGDTLESVTYYLMGKHEAVETFCDEFGEESEVKFTFDELNEAGKETAREWWRRVEAEDFDSEFVIDDAARVAEILGIEFATQGARNPNATYRKPAVFYSGFCCQGDGACFEGSYSYAKGSRQKIREYAPTDKELHRIADELAAIQKRNFYALSASMSHNGHYFHSGCMSVQVDDSRDYDGLNNDDIESLIDLMRDFANWIYRQLEREYEYRMSDESVDESISINEYEFDFDGNLA